jgi:hypothetical protein
MGDLIHIIVHAEGILIGKGIGILNGTVLRGTGAQVIAVHVPVIPGNPFTDDLKDIGVKFFSILSLGRIKGAKGKPLVIVPGILGKSPGSKKGSTFIVAYGTGFLGSRI